MKKVKTDEEKVTEIVETTKKIEALTAEIKQLNKDEKAINELELVVVAKNNEIILPGLGLVKLKATKLKYFKNSAYNNFMVIKSIGVLELLKYADGEEIIKSYLSAVLDVEPSTIDFIDDLDIKTLNELMTKMNEINEIKESDFLTQMQKLEVINAE